MISDETKMKIQYLHRQGLSNGEIASNPDIHLSKKTVDKYVREYEEEQARKLGDQGPKVNSPKKGVTKESDKVLKSEINALRREVEYLRQEVEFMTKIMALKSGDAAFKVPDSPMDSKFKNPKDPEDTE